MLSPQAPTKALVTIMKALDLCETPWIGPRATAAAVAIYDALAMQSLMTNADRDAVVVMIAHRLEEIQQLNDTGISGPSSEQRLEAALRAANVLK